jgi:hypothetical protein
MICEYCQVRQATHYCSTCKHWLCDSPACKAAAAKAAVMRPIKAVARVFR